MQRVAFISISPVEYALNYPISNPLGFCRKIQNSSSFTVKESQSRDAHWRDPPLLFFTEEVKSIGPHQGHCRNCLNMINGMDCHLTLFISLIFKYPHCLKLNWKFLASPQCPLWDNVSTSRLARRNIWPLSGWNLQLLLTRRGLLFSF